VEEAQQKILSDTGSTALPPVPPTPSSCRPRVIDLDDVDARSHILESITATPNPMFIVRAPTLKAQIKTLIESSKAKFPVHGAIEGGLGPQYSTGLEEENTKALENVFEVTVLRILGILMHKPSPEPSFAEQKLKDRGLKVTGCPIIRYYPASEKTSSSSESAAAAVTQRLGAHVDGNFLTLLWATSNGLQVPRADSIDADAVRSFGIPSLTPAPPLVLSDDEWQDVDIEGDSDCVLVTIGDQWFRSDLVKEFGEDATVDCPVLHRVALKKDAKADRYSVPYCCRLVEDSQS
jgi:hypothetical protein